MPRCVTLPRHPRAWPLTLTLIILSMFAPHLAAVDFGQLWRAASTGGAPAVLRLADDGFDINMNSTCRIVSTLPNGSEPLRIDTPRGSMWVAAQAVFAENSPNPLMVAVLRRDLTVLNALLAAHADPSRKSLWRAQGTFFDEQARKTSGNSIAKEPMSCGDLRYRYERGDKLSFIARPDGTEYWFRGTNGDEIGLIDPPRVATPLHLSIATGFDDGAAALESAGANLDESDEQGLSPLAMKRIVGEGNTATVSVFRVSAANGKFVDPEFDVDRLVLAKLDNSRYFEFKVNAGAHEFNVHRVRALKAARVRITVGAGTTTYLRLRANGFTDVFWDLEVVAEDAAKAEISQRKITALDAKNVIRSTFDFRAAYLAQ